MNELVRIGVILLATLLLAIASDTLARRRSKRKQAQSVKHDTVYSEAKRTGQYRWRPVKHDGKAFQCLQTQWEKWRINPDMSSGERVVFWDWSTMSEIKNWLKNNAA